MSSVERRLAAIMFTDMVGYTAVSQRDEALAMNLLERQSGILLPLIREHNGTPVKTIGDAHLAEFGSALDAVSCAVEIQRKLRELSRENPDKNFMLRIGVHVGDVIHKENDVFGDAVNIASRIQPLAAAGQVCISQQVLDQVQNKMKLRFEKLPLTELKNVSSRIEVYKVIDSEAPSNSVWEEELPKERVAVLPLSNFSQNPQDEYLADGMTEELITAISGVQGLRVIARTSVMRFKSGGADVSEIGRILRAGTILEGSFRKAGERIRVTVQLIDSKSQEHMWASNYDGDMNDIFSIQSDIASKVAQVLRGKLLDKEVPSQKPVNLEAYELYLKGRFQWNKRSVEGLSQSLALFQAAIAHDPSFARAYSGVADYYLIARDKDLMNHDEAERLAGDAIKKAIELDDSAPESHASRGLLLVNQERFIDAESEFKRALEINPSYASAHHWYSIMLSNAGRLEDAIEQARLASLSDPLSPPAKNILGVMYLYDRQFDKALEVFNEITRMDPDFAPAYGFRGQIYCLRGMETEAARDMLRGAAADPEFASKASLAYMNCWFGKMDEARRYKEEALRLAPDPQRAAAINGFFAAVTGDRDTFFSLARAMIDSRDLGPADFRYAWWLDKVRDDPRFATILESLPK